MLLQYDITCGDDYRGVLQNPLKKAISNFWALQCPKILNDTIFSPEYGVYTYTSGSNKRQGGCIPR